MVTLSYNYSALLSILKKKLKRPAKILLPKIGSIRIFYPTCSPKMALFWAEPSRMVIVKNSPRDRIKRPRPIVSKSEVKGTFIEVSSIFASSPETFEFAAYNKQIHCDRCFKSLTDPPEKIF